MKTQFYIARHGQTLFNVKHLYQGWCDSPLLEKGIQQAKALHNGLANIPLKWLLVPHPNALLIR